MTQDEYLGDPTCTASWISICKQSGHLYRTMNTISFVCRPNVGTNPYTESSFTLLIGGIRGSLSRVHDYTRPRRGRKQPEESWKFDDRGRCVSYSFRTD